jgi:single-strand DNA-binding protein
LRPSAHAGGPQAFGQLAENAAETIEKGIEVVIVGQLADDNYESGGEKRRAVVLEAQVIAPSLRFATAKLTKVIREQDTAEGSE